MKWKPVAQLFKRSKWWKGSLSLCSRHIYNECNAAIINFHLEASLISSPCFLEPRLTAGELSSQGFCYGQSTPCDYESHQEPCQNVSIRMVRCSTWDGVNAAVIYCACLVIRLNMNSRGAADTKPSRDPLFPIPWPVRTTVVSISSFPSSPDTKASLGKECLGPKVKKTVPSLSHQTAFSLGIHSVFLSIPHQ